MSIAVVPLAPDSPAGIAVADRLSQALADIEFAIQRRHAAKAASELGALVPYGRESERAVQLPLPRGMCAATAAAPGGLEDPKLPARPQ